MMYFVEDAVERMSELHRFGRCGSDSIEIDTGVGIVDDDARAAFALWYDSHRRKSQVGNVTDQVIREDDPKMLGYEVCHFVA